MKDLIERVLDLARLRGAQYADVRVVSHQRQTVEVRNGAVSTLAEDRTEGCGVRVLMNGAWGFAGCDRLDRAGVDRTTAEALAIARASSAIGPPAHLSSLAPQIGNYVTPLKTDPFSVPIEEKITLLQAVDAAMRTGPKVRVTEGSISCAREHKLFGSSEGGLVEQELVETGCSIRATAVGDGDVQTRSYPISGPRDCVHRGWEYVLERDLVGHAPRLGEQATALLYATPCPSGIFTVILDPTQMAFQVHESCGHPCELDRVLGAETGYAGTSFLEPGMMGMFRFGSESVNLVADATFPGGAGTYGWDDEGVPAQRVDLVRAGVLVGFLASRESAAAISLPASTGCMRASGWHRIPIVRMTNIGIVPGEWSLADMIAATDDGILMQTNRSWSIDDRRLNFQFSTEIAWEIRHGKLGQMLKNAAYTGSSPQFWRSVDAVGNAGELALYGLPNCDKGEPGQSMATGHPVVPVRVRGMQVGAGN